MRINIEKLAYKKKTVLENTELDVKKGDFINLIGQNGSGKSSFFKALLGEVKYKGNIDFLPENIAVVSDYAKVPKELKVSDVIKFGNIYLNSNAEELVSLLNLERIASHKIGKLSSGEMRRVEIYVALTSGKEVVIYDEITNALDTGIQKELLGFLKEYHKKSNKIAFYTSHSLKDIFYLKGSIWIINPNKRKIEDISNCTEEDIMKKYVLGDE